MTALILLGLLAMLFIAAIAGLWVAATRRWQARVDAARVQREIRFAERKLHNLTSQAFLSMMETARKGNTTSCPGHR